MWNKSELSIATTVYIIKIARVLDHIIKQVLSTKAKQLFPLGSVQQLNDFLNKFGKHHLNIAGNEHVSYLNDNWFPSIIPEVPNMRWIF